MSKEPFSPFVWPSGSRTTRIPYWAYQDPAIYEMEQERIFRGPTWNYVGLSAELPNPFDYKNTFVGDTPVVVTRAEDGSIHAWVNRCAHRGALVCRDLKGNTPTHTCVYHQWSFDATGELVGVPFRRDIGGKGGYPRDFKTEEHPLRKLKVAEHCGVIFASFADSIEPIDLYLGQTMAHFNARLFNRPIEIIGYSRQYVEGNWKTYADNTHDPYHASFLHLFHATFGLYRATLESATLLDEKGRHNIVLAKMGSDAGKTEAYKSANVRSYQETYTLNDPSVLQGWPEFADGYTLAIHVLFPGLVVQQIANTLATRQLLPKGPEAFELVWTYFGYVDDTPEQRAMRLKQINLIGPAGLISMEDGEVCVLVQEGIRGSEKEASVVEMGGDAIADCDHTLTEAGIRGFWRSWRELVGV